MGDGAGLVQRRPDQRGDDAVRVDEHVGRQAVALVGVEDRPGGVEADRVAQLVSLGVCLDVRRGRFLDADRDEDQAAIPVALG